ncbi:MAG: hypothetical protein ACI9KE_003307 [Polyangiales bacterium]|jgi:hypothetical protein
MKHIMMLVITSLLAITGCVVEETSGRGSETIACTPFAIVTVACGSLGLGSCEGDPILTVCDGDFESEFSCGENGGNFLARNDDQAGFCPGLDVECPASGLLAVRPTAFSGFPTCFWEAVE